MSERLQKFLARAGVASRRHAEGLITAGRVTINNERITELGTKVNAGDLVAVDGQLVSAPEQKSYYVLYKPAGVVTTMEDPQGRPTVADYVAKVGTRLFPVGRLDYDAEGAILFTDDGAIANRLTHPKYEVRRTYLAKVKGEPDEKTLEKLLHGVRLEDGMARPLEADIFEKAERNTWLKLTVAEGRPHLIKRLCAAVGHPVVRLFRPTHGGISVQGMKPGQLRELAPEEVEQLEKISKGEAKPYDGELKLPARRHGHGPMIPHGIDDALPQGAQGWKERTGFDQQSDDGDDAPAPRKSAGADARGGGFKSRGAGASRGGREESGSGGYKPREEPRGDGAGIKRGGYKTKGRFGAEGGGESRGPTTRGFKPRGKFTPGGEGGRSGGYKSRGPSEGGESRGGGSRGAGESRGRSFGARDGESRGGGESRGRTFGARDGESRGGESRGRSFGARDGGSRGAPRGGGRSFGSRDGGDSRGGGESRGRSFGSRDGGERSGGSGGRSFGARDGGGYKPRSGGAGGGFKPRGAGGYKGRGGEGGFESRRGSGGSESRGGGGYKPRGESRGGAGGYKPRGGSSGGGFSRGAGSKGPRSGGKFGAPRGGGAGGPRRGPPRGRGPR